MGSWGNYGQLEEIGQFEQVEKGVNVITLSKDGTQCQCYIQRRLLKNHTLEFQGVSSAMPQEGSFYAPSVAAYASVMEAFVNPALEIFVSSDLAPSVENGNGVKAAKTPVGNHLAVEGYCLQNAGTLNHDNL